MIYATSDLHGWSLDSFLRLLETAGFGDSDCLYVLGDVVDRNGDGGVAMLRWMMGRPNVQLIRGNHEDMLLTCVPWLDRVSEDGVRSLSPEQMQHLLRWFRNGAGPTIRSLQLLKRDLPDTFTRLVDYVKRAPLYASLTAGGRRFVLVHSGFGNFSPEKKLSGYEPDEVDGVDVHSVVRSVSMSDTGLGLPMPVIDMTWNKKLYKNEELPLIYM